MQTVATQSNLTIRASARADGRKQLHASGRSASSSKARITTSPPLDRVSKFTGRQHQRLDVGSKPNGALTISLHVSRRLRALERPSHETGREGRGRGRGRPKGTNVRV
jgi:hypothetical protein